MLKAGSLFPRVTFIENYKRNFWITKEGYRKHPHKKEWEEIKRLDKYTTNQARLTREIAKALNKQTLDGHTLRKLARSQYLYGADITTPALIKEAYMRKFPSSVSPNAVSVLDIETDVNKGTEEIISISLTFRN